MIRRCTALTVLAMMFALPVSAEDTVIHFDVNDEEGNPIPCRIHLRTKGGEAIRVERLPSWHDHFVCSGQVSVPVNAGDFAWEIERGPEYTRAAGVLRVDADQESRVRAGLSRIANLREEGWIGGDLHVHRPAHELETLMRCEDLDFASVIEWWNGGGNELGPAASPIVAFDGHRIGELRGGEDEREGGALLYFGLGRPLDIRSESKEVPSPMRFVNQARAMNSKVWIDIEKPFWWDVPTWIASGQMNSIGIANNHMCRDQVLASEAWGRPRDEKRLTGLKGNGYWTQEIYYHLLETGIRLPPSAGSASGVLPNPVGYNRVYVHVGDQNFTRDAWFTGLSEGRCFVTNGPLLRVTADGEHAGKVFKLSGRSPLQVDLAIQLVSNDPVSTIEVIHNGTIVERIDCEGGRRSYSAKLAVSEPGWFLLRTVADVDHTFRFASTAPWYIDGPDGERRIGKSSAEFFLRWLEERMERVRGNVDDPDEQRAVLMPHRKALEFWQRRIQAATTPGVPIEQTSPGPGLTARDE
ncbi:MAG: CehA/McbA family metallohydrolase [Planctomycetota bacterium]